MKDFENPINLILCRTAILKNSFLGKTLQWLLLELVENVFQFVEISFSTAIYQSRNGKSGNGVKGMGLRMQGIRLSMRGIGVEVRGISVGMWGMQAIRF